MPQLFFSDKSLPTTFTTGLRVAKLYSSKHTGAKQLSKVIQDHVFRSQWKGDKGLSNTVHNIGIIFTGRQRSCKP